MRGLVPPDGVGGVSKPQYAVVYMPLRNRKRFAASCVELCETLDEAVTAADPDRSKYAAQVLGPSKSSEGQYLYYLLEWL